MPQNNRHWLVLVFSVAASACLAVLAGQDSGFDLLNYHYYSGFALLHKAFDYDFAPAQIQNFHNPLMHVLSYGALSLLPAKGAAAFLGAVQGLNFYFVFRISQILFDAWEKKYRYVLSFGCAALGFYGITSNTELGATYGDNILSIPVLAGLLLVLSGLKRTDLSDRNATVLFAAAGFIAGAAFGLKFTCAIYLLGMLAALPPALVGSQRRLRVCIAVAFSSLIGFLVTYGYWGTQLYLSFKNPFFPYLNGIFHSPFFSGSNFLDDRYLPTDWLHTWFFPFYFVLKNNLVAEIEFRDMRLALCYAALVFVAGSLCASFFRRRSIGNVNFVTAANLLQDRCLIFLAIFFTVSYIGWLRISSIYRYLAVLELLAPVLLALTLSRFLRKESWVLVAAAVIFGITAFSSIPVSYGRTEFVNDLLKLQVPPLPDLQNSMVLMTGYEPISYVIPSFPKTTRFVRISSTLSAPGRYRAVDARIRKILAGYDEYHRFAYVPSNRDIGVARLDLSEYGLSINANSCFEIRSREAKQNRGYLCGMASQQIRMVEKPVRELRYIPEFVQASDVEFSGSMARKFLDGRVYGLRSRFIDILFEINGETMPLVRRWPIDESGFIHLGPLSRSGNYRIKGIRDSNAPGPDTWISVDVPFRFE